MNGYMSVFICVCLCIYACLEINFIVLKQKTRKTKKTLSYTFVYFFYRSIQKFVFGGLIGHIATRFLLFLWISWFTKFLGLNSFGTSLNNSYTEFIILNVKFHFICGKLNSCRNTVNCKNIVIDCLTFSHSQFTSLPIYFLKTEISINKTSAIAPDFFSNIKFWVNANMQNSAYKKLLNLKLSRNSCCLLIFLLNLDKGFAVVKNVKKLKFEEN